jgi:hypothetical protein
MNWETIGHLTGQLMLIYGLSGLAALIVNHFLGDQEETKATLRKLKEIKNETR